MQSASTRHSRRAEPTLADAYRVARVFAEDHNVGKVLLFGSVADGTATPNSDIDLVAIYDDLDYSERFAIQSELQSIAAAKSGCPVDVLVTDRVEWKHRTEVVRNSFEAGVVEGAVPLVDCPVGAIDWHKESNMPRNEQAEVTIRLADIRRALRELSRDQSADTDELSSPFRESARLDRLVAVCFHGAMVCEHGLKALIAMQGNPPPHTHNALQLAARLPSHLSYRYSVVDGNLLAQSGRWRQAGTYGSVLEDLELSAEQLLAFAEEYSAASVPFIMQVLEEYQHTYSDTGDEVQQLHSLCDLLEQKRANFDLWSGIERHQHSSPDSALQEPEEGLGDLGSASAAP